MEKGRDVNDGSLDKVKQRRRHRNGFDHLKCFQDFSSEVKIKKYKYQESEYIGYWGKISELSVIGVCMKKI